MKTFLYFYIPKSSHVKWNFAYSTELGLVAIDLHYKTQINFPQFWRLRCAGSTDQNISSTLTQCFHTLAKEFIAGEAWSKKYRLSQRQRNLWNPFSLGAGDSSGEHSVHFSLREIKEFFDIFCFKFSRVLSSKRTKM